MDWKPIRELGYAMMICSLGLGAMIIGARGLGWIGDAWWAPTVHYVAGALMGAGFTLVRVSRMA